MAYKKKSSRAGPPRLPPGKVRIIAGKWRRRRLTIVDAQGLRPTPDRVRESLFAWLEPKVKASRCLDLFAGTGALGFEAASRGAARVVMVESDRRAVAALRQHCETLSADEVEIIESDAPTWLDSAQTPYDIIFLDPPYAGFDLSALCEHIERRKLLKAGGLAYLESAIDTPVPRLPEGWRMVRSQTAGQVRYHLASRASASATPTGDA